MATTKQASSKSTGGPAATKPPSKRPAKKAAAPLDEVAVAPSLGGATALPAVDPILPPLDEVTSKRVSKAAAERKALAAEGKSKGIHPSTTGAAKPNPEGEPKGPRTLAPTDGTQECRTCERTLPLTKFPTKAPAADGTIGRETQCRECRERIRLEKKAAKG